MKTLHRCNKCHHAHWDKVCFHCHHRPRQHETPRLLLDMKLSDIDKVEGGLPLGKRGINRLPKDDKLIKKPLVAVSPKTI